MNRESITALMLVSILLFAGCNNKEESTNGLTSEEEITARALAIHERVLTVDTHADTPLRMIEPGFDLAVRHNPLDTGSKVDYPRMKEGGLDAIFFAAFVSQDIRDNEGNKRAKALVTEMIDAVISSTEENSNLVGLALTPKDAYTLEEDGKRAIYLAIENGYPIGDDLANIELFFNKGVRYITLVHSSNNDIADSATDTAGPEHNGLSAFGEQVVREMNRLGIMVDVSHASDDVFFDAIAISEAPIIATHSNARTVTEHDRNMSDEMLRLMAENGGVVQLTLLSSYLRDDPPNPERSAALQELRSSMKNVSSMTLEERAERRLAFNEINKKFPTPLATVEDVVDHIDQMVSVAGIDHVGIGCDFDGGGGIDGVFDASEVMNITIELVRRGYSEEDIEKIWGKNVMRVFEEVQRIAEVIQARTLS
ncbi:MAG: dipeptidase [Pseudomonadota bacterium]|nr:dipeptidase [Pseudomonadota bacterium]